MSDNLSSAQVQSGWALRPSAGSHLGETPFLEGLFYRGRNGSWSIPVPGELGGYLSLGFTLTGHRVRVYKSNGFLTECDPQQPPIRVKWPPGTQR